MKKNHTKQVTSVTSGRGSEAYQSIYRSYFTDADLASAGSKMSSKQKAIKRLLLCLLGVGVMTGNVSTAESNANWMEGTVGVGWRFGSSESEVEDWNVNTLVDQVNTIPGITYVIFNLSEAAHGDKYIAPHSVLSTLNPGSTPVTRDLFLEAATAFHNEGYKVIAYIATQGPAMLKHGVKVAWDKVEIEPGVYTSQSMDNWEDYVESVYGDTADDTYKQAFAEIIVDEYAARYGTLIDGWWFDNGSAFMNAPLLHDIVTTHNPDVAITFNGSPMLDNDFINGHPTVMAEAAPSDDVNETKMLLPIEASTDGYVQDDDGHKSLGHMFMPAHEKWNSGAIVWTADKAADWVERCNQSGGAWTWNVDVSPNHSNLRADTVTLMQDVHIQIAGNASNSAPVFDADVFDGGEVAAFAAYSASVAGLATDAEGDPLRYHKIDGPDWLTLSTDGSLSGTASTQDFGMNRFKILVGDGMGNVDIAELEVIVPYAYESNGVVDTSRFEAVHIDTGNWIKRDADWSMTGDSLVNPGLVTNDEKGAHLINAINIPETSLSKITVSFDYTVDPGSTLYFHSSLLTGELTDDFLSARISKTGGVWFASDFTDDVSSYGGFSGSEYNLADGSSPTGLVGSEVASFVGGTSGTYSQTFDISEFGGGDFSIADVSHVMAVFTADTEAAGDGAMSIDGFKITIDSNLRAHWALDESSGTVATDSSILGRDTTVSNGTWVSGLSGNAFNFNGSSSTMVLPESAFSDISDEITIAMWTYGGATLPKKNSILYAEDAAGVRCLNIMLPWVKNKIFWDAGGSAGYDRIVKVAETNDFKDQWNHWVFTKNATTGVMNIYLNGNLWHTGSGKTHSIGVIANASLGNRIDSFHYDGSIDEVKLYNRALSAEEVSKLFLDVE